MSICDATVHIIMFLMHSLPTPFKAVLPSEGFYLESVYNTHI